MNGLDAAFSLDRKEFHLHAQLEASANGITGVFGPSGSGKTTLLRCLAGLERAARGHLRLNDETWQDDDRGVFLPAHRRAIGYVFQDARLFPHLNVRDNLTYGAKRVATGVDNRDFDHTIELLGLQRLLHRRPNQLSGGEQQRAAIGRALLTRPRLLLMDEPLAALDRSRKDEILPYLEALHDELSMPVVYVSHAMEEIVRVADQLALIDAGRIQAAGTLTEILPRLDLPPAHADDASVALDVTVNRHDERYHLTHLTFAGGELVVARQPLASGSHTRIVIQARDVSLALSRATDSSILNILEAMVAEIGADREGRCMVRLQVADTPLLARITRKSCERLGLRPGMRLYAQIKSVALAG